MVGGEGGPTCPSPASARHLPLARHLARRSPLARCSATIHPLTLNPQIATRPSPTHPTRARGAGLQHEQHRRGRRRAMWWGGVDGGGQAADPLHCWGGVGVELGSGLGWAALWEVAFKPRASIATGRVESRLAGWVLACRAN